MADDLSPLEFFKKEAINSDAMIRTEAMSKVAVIAAVIGPDKVRNELIPFLQSKYLHICIYLPK